MTKFTYFRTDYGNGEKPHISRVRSGSRTLLNMYRDDDCHTELSHAEGEREYVAQTAKELRKMLRPGDKVYTIVNSVARSGMSRRIECYVATKRGEIRRIGPMVATVINASYDIDKGGILMHGCGMDMTFETVYRLGSALWPKGTRKPHSTRNGEPDNCGGYALNRESL